MEKRTDAHSIRENGNKRCQVEEVNHGVGVGNGTALFLGGRPDTPEVSGRGGAYEGGRAPRAAHFSLGP